MISKSLEFSPSNKCGNCFGFYSKFLTFIYIICDFPDVSRRCIVGIKSEEFQSWTRNRFWAEVALGWEFFGIPIRESQIPGIWDFIPPKTPEAKIPKNPKSPGLGFFFVGNPKIPKNPGILFLYLKNNRFSFPWCF